MEEIAERKTGLNSNALKLIAIFAMTLDHVISVIFPNYPMDWWILLCHVIGRLTAPIMWFFIAEGYHHTRNVKRYAARLFIFAIISHFAYNFAFGIPFIPFKTSVFNQTSVIWALAWGLIALIIADNSSIPKWQKTLAIILTTLIAFPADWSSIAVLSIVWIGTNRGNFKAQMTGMVLCTAIYAVVYAVFINPVYGVIQMFTALSIPVLKSYNGERGKMSGMKWLFYIYHPAHLLICGIIRLMLHGNVGVMIGG